MTPEDMAAQDRIYARSLSAFELPIVSAACEEWATTPGNRFWPELSELLRLCREHERLAEIAARPKLAAPEPDAPRQAQSNEVVLQAWRENDRLADEIRAHPEAYLCGRVLLKAHANAQARRFAERPDLAAVYYAAADAAGAA